jgi:catechol 2,3-dioxygenase-like lactoylglutathione lyase family enzyme
MRTPVVEVKPALTLLFTGWLLAMPSLASAQLLSAKDGPIVYGHHHVGTANVEAQKRFFVDALGGELITIGTNNTQIVKFPNVFIFFRQQAPTGGTEGTTVNHVGFSVQSLQRAIDRLKEQGFPILPSPTGNPLVAFTMGPDGVKVELLEVKDQAVPIALREVHFFNPQNTEMQAWYVKTFGATPRSGGGNPAATLPGVTLIFSPSPTPVAGTAGRAIDHIGFEVKNLEAFVKDLQSKGIALERPYTAVPALNTHIAYVRDPWGTLIELVEGLDVVK